MNRWHSEQEEMASHFSESITKMKMLFTEDPDNSFQPDPARAELDWRKRRKELESRVEGTWHFV